MRRAISLVIFAGFLAGLAAAQQAELSPDSGALVGKRYANGYFGFSYRFPEGWKGGAVTRAAASAGAPTRFYALFSAAPAGGAGNDLRYISIQADEAPARLRNPRDFMNASFGPLTGSGGAFQALRSARAEYAGHEFFRQDLRSRSAGGPQFLQTQLVMVERGYGITFSFIAANKDDLEELVRSAESLEFFAPGSLPQAPAAPVVAVAKAAAPAQAAMQVAADSAPEPVTVVVIASAPARSSGSGAPLPGAASPKAKAVTHTETHTEVASAKADSAEPAATAAIAGSSEDPGPTEVPAVAQDATSAPMAPAPKASVSNAGDQVAVVAEPLAQQIAAQPQAAPPVSEAIKPAPKSETQTVATREVAVQAPSRDESRDIFAHRQTIETLPAPNMAMSFAAPRVVAPPALSQPLYASASLRGAAVESAPAKRDVFVAPPAGEPQAPVAERASESPVMAARVEIPAQLPAQPPPATPARLKISAVSFESYIVRKGRMVYPELARAERVQGDVVMRVVVSTAGQLTDIRAISGPTLLRQGALEAVKSWAFRPYLVNGAPVEVESEISVAFRLAQ